MIVYGNVTMHITNKQIKWETIKQIDQT
jgi:hypothetical protein